MHLHLANTSRVPGGFTPWSIAAPHDLQEHVFITGTGPDPGATLLRLAEQRIHAGDGLAVVDAGGHLAEQSLLAVPRVRSRSTPGGAARAGKRRPGHVLAHSEALRARSDTLFRWIKVSGALQASESPRRRCPEYLFGQVERRPGAQHLPKTKTVRREHAHLRPGRTHPGRAAAYRELCPAPCWQNLSPLAIKEHRRHNIDA